MTSRWVSSHCPEEWVSLSRRLLTGNRRAGITPPTRFIVSWRVETKRALDFFFLRWEAQLFRRSQNFISRFMSRFIASAPHQSCWKEQIYLPCHSHPSRKELSLLCCTFCVSRETHDGGANTWPWISDDASAPFHITKIKSKPFFLLDVWTLSVH